MCADSFKGILLRNNMKANLLIEEVKKMCKERGLTLLDIKVSDDEGTSRHYVPKAKKAKAIYVNRAIYRDSSRKGYWEMTLYKQNGSTSTFYDYKTKKALIELSIKLGYVE